MYSRRSDEIKENDRDDRERQLHAWCEYCCFVLVSRRKTRFLLLIVDGISKLAGVSLTEIFMTVFAAMTDITALILSTRLIDRS